MKILLGAFSVEVGREDIFRLEKVVMIMGLE
jgi:hypothetical protein